MTKAKPKATTTASKTKLKKKTGTVKRNLKRNATIAEMSLSGMTTREIAKEVGLHYTTVAKTLNNEECQAIYDKLHRTNAGRAEVVNDTNFILTQHHDPLIQLRAINLFDKKTGMREIHTQQNLVIIAGNQIVQTEQVPRICEAFQLLEQADLSQEAEIIDTDDKAAE